MNELFESDIIEEVSDGPMEWVSLLVVVPKNDGDVRIPVDMRRANKTVIRKIHLIPTVEELLHKLNGSVVFSKLNSKWGFYQIVLDEGSRRLPLSHLNQGLFCYKRLMFRLSSAPQKYLKIICDLLKNC